MTLLKNYLNRSDPTRLQREVIFNIIWHFGFRGREWLRGLNKDSVIFLQKNYLRKMIFRLWSCWKEYSVLCHEKHFERCVTFNDLFKSLYKSLCCYKFAECRCSTDRCNAWNALCVSVFLYYICIFSGRAL